MYIMYNILYIHIYHIYTYTKSYIDDWLCLSRYMVVQVVAGSVRAVAIFPVRFESESENNKEKG